ncbi:three component ABC system middle component [Asticcacaulis sp. EMRT-3]|uniref:three component ABC system middle component n=1 Tax=Asticcacaulis sp. EMRT-3 TaxID=3040349 RepID=UPI0024AFC368|nr:three component ABC system middle component [Asticcacaulis sp. EMRT-3]MDI7774700.1 DUF6521 family protein [Asticcacaulis sp. EMRT-3]
MGTVHTHWDLVWRERPPEEAAFFNPAFCGEMLFRTVKEYTRVTETAFPLAISFIILPLLLHPASRHSLPRKSNTAFSGWSADHDAILAQIPDRMSRLRSVTRESLLFLAQMKVIDISGDGVKLGSNPLKLSAKPQITTKEVDDIRSAAGLLGRWFASQAKPAMVLQSMGVRI